MSDELSGLDEEGYTASDWQKHYDEGDLPWDLGEVAPPFVQLFESGRLPGGRMVIPGCGQGHEVVFFAGRGYEVTAVDVAPGAVERLRRNLQSRGLTARVLHQDFFTLDASHDRFYDVFLEHTFFCAIHPSQRPHYVEMAARILKPGGVLAGLFYETGERGGPPFNTTGEDIRHHFGERFHIRHLEKCKTSAERRQGKEWLALLERK